MTLGDIEIDDLVAYQACTQDAGTDVYYGFYATEETDPTAAAQKTVQLLAKNTWKSATEADITDAGNVVTKTTDTGITGQLAEAKVNRPGGADACGTTASRVVAFAFKNAADDLVVMIAGSRFDGDTVKSDNDFVNDVVATIQSLKES